MNIFLLSKNKKKRLGPGHYNIKYSFEAESFKPQSKRGMLDTASARFSDYALNNNPGMIYLAYSSLFEI
jgi:hypothetical protein